MRMKGLEGQRTDFRGSKAQNACACSQFQDTLALVEIQLGFHVSKHNKGLESGIQGQNDVSSDEIKKGSPWATLRHHCFVQVPRDSQ